jgi:hypothetical protein
MKFNLSNKYTPSKEVVSFLDQYVSGKMPLAEMNDDNIESVIEFIADTYENPLSQDKRLSKESKKLLNLASNAITELSTKAYH